MATANAADDLRTKMMGLNFNSAEGSTAAESSSASSPAGSWATRPSRPRPSLNVGGCGKSGGAGPRRPPGSLTFTTTPSPGGGSVEKNRFASGNLPESSVVEQERKLKEIMNQTGMLQVSSVLKRTQP